MRRFAVIAAACALCVFAFAAPASGAAGPRYIVVHGGGLDSTVLLDDIAGNELLVSSPDVEPRSFVPREADRPVYELAFFFIVPDLAGRSPSDLRPDETGATGRFYPAVGELEAIFELGAVPGIGPRRDGGLTPPMLDYLASRGVPVTSDVVLGPESPTPTPSASVTPPVAGPEGEDGGLPGWVYLVALGAGLVAVMAFVGGRAQRRRPRRRGVHF